MVQILLVEDVLGIVVATPDCCCYTRLTRKNRLVVALVCHQRMRFDTCIILRNPFSLLLMETKGSCYLFSSVSSTTLMLHFRGIRGTSSSVILPSSGGLELDRERTLGPGVEHWAGLDSLPRR
jgi:hypothetical protein